MRMQMSAALVLGLAAMMTGCRTFYPGTSLSVESPTGKSIKWENEKDFGLIAKKAKAKTADGTEIEFEDVSIGNSASDAAKGWEGIDRGRGDAGAIVIDSLGRFAGVVLPGVIQQQPPAPPTSQPAAQFPTFPMIPVPQR